MPSSREPFDQPEEVALLLGRLFRSYISYAPYSFLFEWLEKTPDLEVHCRDATGEKVLFTSSPELLKAIHECERVTAPEKFPGLPSDWGFSSFIKTAVHQVLDKVYIKIRALYGPLFRQLYSEMITGIKGVQVLCPHQNHWTFIVRDHSCAHDMGQKGIAIS
uniref:Uncharacterized protein n=1 Tax=Coccidioides posadasii RMSCC 3488 TaxID=454284 RepID=A0A0J6F895_COCPO|nr:hypothetical protein CPAG_01496 [Coccidioides posadasii RMSCC 3488]